MYLVFETPSPPFQPDVYVTGATETRLSVNVAKTHFCCSSHTGQQKRGLATLTLSRVSVVPVKYIMYENISPLLYLNV